MKLFLTCIFLILTIICCNEYNIPTDYNDIEKAIEKCLNEYKDCDSLISRSHFSKTPNSRFVIAKWESRKRNYIEAKRILEDIEIYFKNLPLNSLLLQDYVLTRIDNDAKLAIYDKNFIYNILKKIKPNNKELIPFYIQMLLRKSNLLRESNNINHALATSMLAYLISERTTDLEDDIGMSEYFHAINLMREDSMYLSKIYLDKAEIKCIDLQNPICRKIKVLQLTNFDSTMSINLNSKSINKFYGIHYNQFTPSIDKFIDTQINQSEENTPESLFKKISQVDTAKDICNVDFYNAYYLIDDLIKLDSLSTAKKYLDRVLNCEDIRGNKKYMLLYGLQQYYYSKYRKECIEDDLHNAIKTAQQTVEYSKNKFTRNQNLHFAGFIADINETLLQCIHYLSTEDSENFDFDNFKNNISSVKQLFNKISDAKFKLTDKIISQNDLNKYKDILENIEYLELEINEYKDTKNLDLPTYELLDKLYDTKYELENSLPDKIKSPKDNIDWSSLPDSLTQVFDISGSKEYYYFSYITKDTIIIEKYNRSEIDTTIRNISHSNFSHQDTFNLNANLRIRALIQPYLNVNLPNIIFIPDKDFIDFPFEQLVISSARDSLPTYLCNKFNISYEYNLKNLFKHSRNRIKDEIALFSYTNDETKSGTTLLEIAELPIGWEEVKEVSNIYPNSNTYSGKSLSKKNILKNKNTSIMHFSTHGDFDNTNILDNYLVIRKSNLKTEKLYGFEVKNHEFKSNLIILSACSTGLGSYKPGAGIFSLSSNFIQAGVQTVIKSLWNVDEASTSKLMVNFHKYFKKGYNASMSLTLAKRELISHPKYKEPYYWAGFVLEGNPNITLMK